MKTTLRKWALYLALLSIFLTQANAALPQLPPGLEGIANPLASWSFKDTNNWTTDQGYSPISFTNLSWSNLGDGWSLVVNTNGVPAWLNYDIIQPTNGATNLVLNGPGSITFWYAPDWSSGTNGGTGPGQWAQLVNVGEWTSNATYGYWGISVDSPGSNIVFLSRDGLGNTYGLSSPISWTTNNFHFIALTYSSTNVSLYLDGQLATNDPGGLSIWPDPDVAANGLFFGSDTNGNEQANGMFNTVETYTTTLGSNQVQEIYSYQRGIYSMNPFDIPFLLPASSNPSTNSFAPDVITGSGFLQSDGPATGCAYSTNGYYVWITNFVATMTGNGTMNVTFSINGGTSGWMYDVFANPVFSFGPSGDPWVWVGQGPSCYTYTITDVDSSIAFLILGTPLDSNGADLTDAYQLLVSKTDPKNPYDDPDGLLTGWEILLGLNPHISNINNPSQRLNYIYTSADWVTNISGINGSSSITMDNEGNVRTVSE
jgi:hypothetical protein